MRRLRAQIASSRLGAVAARQWSRDVERGVTRYSDDELRSLGSGFWAALGADAEAMKAARRRVRAGR